MMTQITEYVLSQVKDETIRDIRDKTGIPQITVWRLKNKKYPPTVDHLDRLMKAYNITPQKIFWHLTNTGANS
jgi:transcriptional regulator with XRE-family HTH domain